MIGAKRRLTKIETFLVKISPPVYGWVDRFFNLPRYLDKIYLEPLFTKKYARALDLGSGKGALTRSVLVHVGRELVCLDVNQEELKISRRRAPAEERLKFVLADATDLPFPNNSFDLVFCNCVIEHIKDDAAVFGEIYRCLKSGGELIITFPNADFKPAFKSFLWRHPFWRFLADSSLKKYFGFKGLEVAEAWYAQVRWQHFRRGYLLEKIRDRFGELGFEIKSSFYYPSASLSQVWDFLTFSFLNQFFPYLILVFAPLFWLFPKRQGDEKMSLEFAVKAIKR